MQCHVYRSLDKSALFFGMRGRFSLFFFIGIGADLFLSFILGAMTSGILGTIVFIVIGVAVYAVVLSLQAGASERVFSKRMAAGKIPEVIHVKPVKLRGLLDNTVWDRKQP